MKNREGEIIKKEWTFVCSCQKLADVLDFYQCTCTGKHGEIHGKTTPETAYYPEPLAVSYLGALFGSYVSAYACPCKASVDEEPHRKKVKKLPDFAASACDDVNIIDHDFYVESAAQSNTGFE